MSFKSATWELANFNFQVIFRFEPLISATRRPKGVDQPITAGLHISLRAEIVVRILTFTVRLRRLATQKSTFQAEDNVY